MAVDCTGCQQAQPPVRPENQLLWLIVENFGAYFFDGMSGLNVAGIKLAIDFFDIPDIDKPMYFKRLANFLTAFRKAQNVQQNYHRTAKQG